MSLLRQIQDAAVDSKTDVASLLRTCKILAARLGNDEFKKWVESELSGYESIEDLPDYRVLRVNSKGHFSGPFGSGLRNADIPLFSIPEDFREHLDRVYLTMSVAAMESLVEKSKSGTLSEPWSPDLVAHVGRGIYQNMNCMQAWKVIPASAVVAAIDSVKTRVLNFVLEIEATDPTAGEAAINSNPIPQEQVQHIFNTYVTGTVQNLATGNSGGVTQRAKYTEASSIGTLTELLDAIKAAQLPANISQAAESSVEEMRASLGQNGFKAHYPRFMATLADHMQVLGPIVAPYLTALSAMVS